MSTMHIWRVFFLGFLVGASVLWFPGESAGGDPSLKFFTIKTEHFNVHFQEGLLDTARRGAAIFEEVHGEISILYGWEEKRPLDVVISDNTDSANGWAQVMFKPLMHLYVTAPDTDSALQNYDNWLRTLFTHEYTHIVQLRIHSGIARIINAIFGDIYLPNQVSPKWYSEGLAVLSETELTSGGRIRSSSYKMQLRTAALDGTLLTLDELSNGSREWPHGWSTGYLYGAIFFDYVKRRFGIEKVVQLSHEYGGAPLPYGFNRTFKRVLGVELVDLYREWQEELTKESVELKNRLETEGLTASTPLTTDGEYKGNPIFGLEDEDVFIAIGNGMEKPGLYRISVDGKTQKLIALARSSSPLSMDRSGRLFYSRSAPYKKYYSFSDVFALDRLGQDPRRVTSGARAWWSAISPRGDKLAMSINKAGSSHLVIADERGHIEKTLIESANGDQVYSVAWSPDNRTIAATVRKGANLDIVLVDSEGGETRWLTDDRFLDSNPAFDPTGRYLLFQSDRTGIFNIYSYDLKEQAIRQVTNVLTGAFAPAVSHDGSKLAFTYYSSRGYDLHLMPFSGKDGAVAQAVEPQPTKVKPTPPPVMAPVRKYNPLPSLVPRHWQFNISSEGGDRLRLEAITAMSDAAGRHSIGASVYYRLADDTISGSIGYSFAGLGPGFHLGVSHVVDPREDGYVIAGKAKRWIQQVTRASVSLSYPIPGVDRSHSLSLGYSVTYAEPYKEPQIELDPREELPRVPRQYFRAGLDFNWGFQDLISSPLGISPHKGRALGAGISLYHPVLGGEQTLATFTYGWTEYFAMPWLEYHVLALHLGGGAHVSHPPKQASFSMGGYNEQNIVDAIWNNKSLGSPSLRGYAPGSFQGDQYHSLKLSYRFPLWFTEVGYATLPVFLRRIQAGIFTDNGLITFDPPDRNDWKSSVGAEIVWVINIAYYQIMTLRTGYAYGLMTGGIHEVIVVLGSGF